MNPISKLLALIFVAACVTVGLGTGAYLALRDNGARTPQAVTADMIPAEAQVTGTGAAVTETEAEVEPAVPAVESAPVEVARPAAPAARRSPSPARTRPQAANAEPPAPTGTGETARVDETPATPAWPESRPTLPEPIEERPIEPVAGDMFGRSTESLPSIEPAPQFEEVRVPAEAVIGLQIENTVTTEKAKVEDPVDARVTRDVRAGGLVAIPAGSRVHGSVTFVEEGGKVKERARLGVRFHTLVLADGTRVPLETETVFREGESPAGESAAKIGGAAVGGAILGAILGGGRGAAIGGSVGAAGGTAAVMAGGRNPATLPAGSTVTVRLTAPVSVTVEK
jgi:hypothetical protein